MPTEADAEPPDEVVYFYSCDVANEIRLDRAAELFSGRSAPLSAGGTRRARCPSRAPWFVLVAFFAFDLARLLLK
jgi:hypothetical protein